MNDRSRWNLPVASQSCGGLRCLVAVFLCWAAGAASLGAEEQTPVPWNSDFETARREAIAAKRPIFVRVVGPACPWCRKLDQEIKLESVQAELGRWTCLELDVEIDSREARQLQVGPIPALRVLSPQGRLTASHDGFLEATELIKWLGEQFDAALETADELLLADSEPTLVEVLQIAKLLGHRDATVREAALARLRPYPKAAGPAMFKLLRQGPLVAQLTAVDLLAQWEAPIDELDPWQPETLSPDRLAKLAAWLAEVSPEGAAAVRETITDAELRQAADEIDRMLAGDEAGAVAGREQLARFGPALLPEVYGRIKNATEDRARQRLVALRYRLVAPSALTLRWPEGLERLADGDVKVRHKAVEELVGQASAEHERLLLELFSDPDPLVRELALRGLEAVSGSRAASALVKLLDDPDPNVRAAVLKQLTSNPSPRLMDAISAYIAKESDPDLVVHAVRYFGTQQGASILEPLEPLLAHPSWQVRSEVARALSERAREARFADPDEAVGLARALAKALGDEDAYVVARALEGLEYVGTSSAVEPLAKAVERDPSLAGPVLKVLVRSEKMREKATPYLRQYLTHEQPGVRAAAIGGLAEFDSESFADELMQSLSDPERSVRVAGATALLDLLDRRRQQSSLRLSSTFQASSVPPATLGILGALARLIGGRPVVAEPAEVASPPAAEPAAPAAEEIAAQKPVDDKAEAEIAADESSLEEDSGSQFDAWLEEVYQGKHRPEWTRNLVEPLTQLAQSTDAEERSVALVALLPLGKAELAAPRLLNEAKSDAAEGKWIVRALPWLTWPPREILARELAAAARGEAERTQLAAALAQAPDERSAPLLWELLGRTGVSQSEAEMLQSFLTASYLGQRYYDASAVSVRAKRGVLAACKQEAAKGTPVKRLVALNLILQYAPDEAPALAKVFADDEAVRKELGGGGFQLYLAALPNDERAEQALAAMRGDDLDRRRVALAYLATGAEALGRLAGGYPLHVAGHVERDYFYTRDETPSLPKPPAGVTVEQVRPLVEDADLQVAACAGYLLALFGEPEGLEAVMKYWRERSLNKPDIEVDRMAYRAIAALDDAEHFDVLRQIAARLDQHQASEFYWTIRILTGPEALKLRKEIRDKFGMENLR